jgi:hypothetical protein
MLQDTIFFDRYGYHKVSKIIVLWKHLCFSFAAPVLYSMRPAYGLLYPIVMGRSSFCLLCVCMWLLFCASISHSDGSFFLLCCTFAWVPSPLS